MKVNVHFKELNMKYFLITGPGDPDGKGEQQPPYPIASDCQDASITNTGIDGTEVINNIIHTTLHRHNRYWDNK